jgi:hypothetical protein
LKFSLKFRFQKENQTAAMFGSVAAAVATGSRLVAPSQQAAPCYYIADFQQRPPANIDAGRLLVMLISW